MDFLFKRASKLNLCQKIDTSEDLNSDYIEKWNTVLDKYDILIGLLSKLEKVYESQRVPADCFLSIPATRKEIVDFIDADSSICDEKLELAQRIMEKLENLPSTATPDSAPDCPWSKPSDNVFNKRMHVVDLDFELFSSGLFMILYCKSIDDGKTYTVVEPFTDYFYVKTTVEESNSLEKKLFEMDKKIRWMWSKSNQSSSLKDCRKSLENVEHSQPGIISVSHTRNLKNAYGYQEKNDYLLRVETRHHLLTKAIERKFHRRFLDEDKSLIPFEKLKFEEKYLASTQLFETNIEIGSKYLASKGMACFDEIEISGCARSTNTFSTTDYFVNASKVQRCEDDRIYTPRILTFDLETLAKTAAGGAIIQISVVVSEGGPAPIFAGVLCLRETPGYEWFETEEQMLYRFCNIVLEYDPDIISGYNINTFDLPYVLERCEMLGVTKHCCIFSRRKNLGVYYHKQESFTKQFGTKTTYTYVCPGRTMFDLYPYMKDNHKLPQYRLDDVARAFLVTDRGEPMVDWTGKPLQKEDMPYEEIPVCFQTPEGRVRIASYCLHDSVLVYYINKVLLLDIVVVSMCKVLGCTLDVTLNRGKGFKLIRKLLDYTKREGYVLPSFNAYQKPPIPGSYTGAVVLDPVCGYYEECVSVLDFKSLYPSLIIGYNLSLDTYVTCPGEVDANDCETTPSGDTFVKASKHEGLLPKLENELWNQRDLTKKQMKSFPKDSIEYNVYDGKQLAIKQVMNSLYGILAAPTFSIPLINIAQSITSLGRFHIESVKAFIETKFHEITTTNHEVKVIYGDTDSVFVCMRGMKDVALCAELSTVLANEINKQMYESRSRMEIEFEKIFYPFLLLAKKKYISVKYEGTTQSEKAKVSYSGVAIVRRSCPEICADVMRGFINKAFGENDLEGALALVQGKISEFWQGKYSVESFKLTTLLPVLDETKKSQLGHVKAWLDKRKRLGDVGCEVPGDRFAYMVSNSVTSRKKAEKCVDWDYVLEKNIQPDLDHYYDIFIFNPMKQILEYMIPRKRLEEVLNKDNYEKTIVTVVPIKRGMITSFFTNKDCFKKRVKFT